MSAVMVRRPRRDELPALYAELSRGDREQVDLGQAWVLVAEEDGEVVGFAAARLLVQVEPLHVMDAVRTSAPRHRVRRITLALARGMDELLYKAVAARGGYYACIRVPVMQRLAEHFGLREVYREGKWFLREWRS